MNILEEVEVIGANSAWKPLKNGNSRSLRLSACPVKSFFIFNGVEFKSKIPDFKRGKVKILQLYQI